MRKKTVVALTLVIALIAVLSAVCACEPTAPSLDITVLPDARVYEGDGLDAVKKCIRVEYVNAQGKSSEITDYVLKGSVTAGSCEFTVVYGETTETFKLTVESGSGITDGSEGIKYVLKDDGTYEAYDIGFCKDRDIVIPSKYDGKNVTGIAKNAFRDCKDITSVTVASGIKSIGEHAFYGSSRIKTVTLPDSVEQIDEDAFYGCEILEKVYYDGGIVDWCKISFENRYANPATLAEKFYIGGSEVAGQLNIPETVTSVGDYAFCGVDNVTEVGIAEGVKEIGESAFAFMPDLTSAVMANNIEKIDDRAFKSCPELVSIHFPSETAKLTIGEEVLLDCKKLTTMSVNFIGSDKLSPDKDNAHIGYLFGASSNYDNQYLIPSSLKTVNVTEETAVSDRAFYHAKNIVTVNYKRKITAVGNYAFADCPALRNVNVLDEVTSIGEYAFWDCKDLHITSLPATLKTVGSYAFYKSGITRIDIKSRLTVLSDNVFASCRQLTEVVLPDCLTQICESAFQSCELLTEISIPQSVTKIGSYALSSGIKNIKYGGNMSQWKRIALDPYWNGASSGGNSQKVVCKDGTITL